MMLRGGFSPHHQPHRPDRPPFHHQRPFPEPPRERPVFAVVLECRGRHGRGGLSSKEVEDLMSSCPSKPENKVLIPMGPIVGKLFFRQWLDALDALCYFWDRRLKGPLNLPCPKVLSNNWASSDKEEGDSRLKELFAAHARGLLDCDQVRKLEREVDEVSAQVSKVEKLLKNHNSMEAFCKLRERAKGLVAERNQLLEMLEEFRAAIRSLLVKLGEPLIEGSVYEDGGVEIFDFGGALDWWRVHNVMVRECRRLQEGLPIYGCRRDILNDVNSNQVIVLIGETGSGKSTQIVQFLADSGLDADGTILCTQPRRIAAVSLAQRVGEESYGCYTENFIVSYPSYSSTQKFNSNVVFMTDHCLLQHCMNDMSLAGVSYIVVDEAHERSLNTDLLLALIKKQLLQRFDLRLIIMSATADATKLSNYFFGCRTFHVIGRNFPVYIECIPDVSAEVSWASITKQIPASSSSYISDTVKMVSVVHQIEESGDILAFLTAQMEVEWACEIFRSPSAVVLPLHGKLSCEEQRRIFQNYPGKRKVIFTTNLAETSLTIPGVKYVIDSGMVKESRFEPTSGMNVLRVCPVSQSSARQRAGRAGRTEPGKCYRLYSDSDFQSMPLHQEPEIRKVHLGIAVLKILALGITNVDEFEFVDAPSPKAIDTAVRNLIQLGAVVYNAEALKLTDTGRKLVRLGVEPRLGKLILDSFDCGLGKEGIVLASVMANASSIFCRVGSDEDKAKADCLKVPFCHHAGDIFTLLSVYKEWEREQNRNQWCWQNSINAKSMRRCHDTVQELEHCLRHELNITIPSNWKWDPNDQTYEKLLKKVILYSLAENVAVYSGYERLGYEVALTGENMQLHPSCSLLIYGQKPSWVVFGEILSISKQYLVCVTAIDHESLYTIKPPLFDVSELERRKMQMTAITVVGSRLLRRLCGKGNNNLRSLVSCIQTVCNDSRADIIVDFDKGVIQLFASSRHMEAASSLVNDVLDYETKWLRDECIEKSLFRGIHNVAPSVALFGSGAEIKHLELDKRYLTVEICHPIAHALDDKQLLMMVDRSVSNIANFYKHVDPVHDITGSDKWGKITFLSPEVAQDAVNKLNGMQLCGSSLKVCPVRSFEVDTKLFPCQAVKAKVCWPRRRSKGVAFVRCSWDETDEIVQDCANLVIGGRYVRCEASTKFLDVVILGGIDKNVLEAEIYDALRSATKKRIIDVWLLRGDPIDQPPCSVFEEALLREIVPFLSAGHSLNHTCRVEVFNPETKDFMMKAMITFDGSLHLEAATALDHLQGKVLPGCQSWQRIECQRLFRSSISCHPRVYDVIRKDLDSVLESFRHHKGVSCELDKSGNGSYRVKLCANATKTIADVRKPLELLMKGKTITHSSLTPTVLDLLLSKDGFSLMKSVERETTTHILYDRQKLNLKIFGCNGNVEAAELRLIQALLSLHENKQFAIPLRGNGLPPDLMKEVFRKFGPDLHGLKEKAPGVEFHVDIRCHKILVRGNKEQKQTIQEVVTRVTESLGKGRLTVQPSDTTCTICLCELEEPYKLEACGHDFCRTCLIEQCESAIKSHDGFPLCCVKEGCKAPFLLADLRSLLMNDKLEELFRASLGAFVASSGGTYRFCPSPDCPSIYRVADPKASVGPFVCGACSAETCTKCHLEYHPFISCEMYKEFKEHPDSSLMEWRKGKEYVKNCPVCRYTIEKIDGCNHIACKCGKHICWVCLENFETSDDCYAHLRSVHLAII